MAKRKLTLMERRLHGEIMPNEDSASSEIRAKMKHIISVMGANYLGEWSGTAEQALLHMREFFPRSIPSAMSNMKILEDDYGPINWHSARFTLKYTIVASGVGADRVFIGTTSDGIEVQSIFYQGRDPQGSQRYYRYNGSRQLRV